MQPRRHENTKKKGFSSCLRVLVVACVTAATVAAAPDLTVKPIQRDGRVLVTFELTDGFTTDVRDAIRSGLSTTFSYQIDLRRSAATWFDRTIASTQGGVRPKWAHGSSVTTSVAPSASSPALSSARTSAWASPARR